MLLGHLDLRALAGALHPFEGDEQAGGGRSLEFGHEGERDGSRQTVPLEQSPGVDPGGDDHQAGDREREPRSRQVDPVAADVELIRTQRIRDRLKICANAGKAASDRNRNIRDSVVSAPNVRPRNSSTTFSCSSV